ncbi:MAG: O-methyltransferase [Chloroflexi bacterium]|jgi:caffeoyl-CoA O-methyltransferase|nr:O-methyltransferase [Chloroflexota bacterium]MBT3670188.1 O-methyltransferase [Chloroflexota bacterium]MBT4004058.1 O-methyltransferase [Chloroflexota bacterium]MBT4306138.1 O-methyltransferase [Chloroflexota bacterium]MBT4534518.1 O-methyltransferase [Chloroflexota bacterium]
MFHDIPKEILDQMKVLEELDAQDRQDGTNQITRLRQIPPETGKFIAIQAASVPEGAWVEIGTSAGYSALWISLAAKLKKEKLFTYELLQDKVALAKNTFKQTKVTEVVELVHGDARGHVGHYEEIAFAFLDSEKEMYEEFYDLIVPLLVPGGLLIADNFLSHEEYLAPLKAKAEGDERIDSVIVPIGRGLLLSRKV